MDYKAQKLLKHLLKKQNKSGSIKPAAQSLLKLKEALEKVPFQLQSKGMSGVVSGSSMMKGVQKAAQLLGSLGAVGEFKNALGKVQARGSSLDSATADQIAAVVSQADIEEALGGASALGLSLMAGLDESDQREIDSEAPKSVG